MRSDLPNTFGWSAPFRIERTNEAEEFQETGRSAKNKKVLLHGNFEAGCPVSTVLAAARAKRSPRQAMLRRRPLMPVEAPIFS